MESKIDVVLALEIIWNECRINSMQDLGWVQWAESCLAFSAIPSVIGNCARWKPLLFSWAFNELQLFLELFSWAFPPTQQFELTNGSTLSPRLANGSDHSLSWTNHRLMFSVKRPTTWTLWSLMCSFSLLMGLDRPLTSLGKLFNGQGFNPRRQTPVGGVLEDKTRLFILRRPEIILSAIRLWDLVSVEVWGSSPLIRE